MDKMNIRAHHLLCIRNFKGNGYSKEFVDNFYKVLERLPEERIKIVNSVDVICEKCPHNKKGICKKKKDSEKKARELDGSIINAASINLDEEYSYNKLQKLIRNIHVKDFCKDCEWKDYCQN